MSIWSVLGTLLVILEIGLRLLALGVIPGGRKPSTGMAWLLLILVEPIIGFCIFLLFGHQRIGRERFRRQKEAFRLTQEHTRLVSDAAAGNHDELLGTVVELNHRLGALPLQEDNNIELIEDYESSLRAMATDVAGAERFVHVEFYITAWDEMTHPLFQALADAAERGVSVRLLFDHLGSRGIPGYPAMIEKLEATKIEWRPMLPIQPFKGRFRRPDLRNHRKILVVDGTVAFTGSQNLTEPGYNKPKNHKLGRKWVELMVRAQGPAVAALNAVFAADWLTETGALPDIVESHPAGPATGRQIGGVACQLVPSGPGIVKENNLRMFTSLIYSAKRRISLTSPYFVPDESLLYAVTTAAERGIDVELFVSELSDQFMVGHAQASYYRALLESGVRIYLYPAPYILHSKHFTIDDNAAVIGSSNMDQRSFALNYEASLMMLGEPIATAMREVEDHYRARSRELTIEEWSSRPVRKKYVDNVMRLTAGLQ
ncbi:MAG: cardiolipin synthase [Nocardioidaceae bacterium]